MTRLTQPTNYVKFAIIFLVSLLHSCAGIGTQNVSTTSSFKDTDVVTAVDQFEAGNLMANVTRPPLHRNYNGTAQNVFSAPSMIHGFKPVYDSDAQFVSITTEAPQLGPPPRSKPGFTLFKKKKKRPPAQVQQLPEQHVPPSPPPPAAQVSQHPQSIEESGSGEQQRIPIYTQFNSHQPHYHNPPPAPPMSPFSRLASMFRRQPPPWRPPQAPMPIPTHFSTQGPGPSPSPQSFNGHHVYGQGPVQSQGHYPHGGPQQAASINAPIYSRPGISQMPQGYPPKTPHHRVSLNHYLQKISNMFSRSPHVPGYRPYAYPQSPAYPNYFPLNTYAPHGQQGGVSTVGPMVQAQARRKKLRVKKPSADRRLHLDQQYLTGRPRATKESDPGKPDTMEVKLHTGIHTESRGINRNRLFNTVPPVFVRFKRDVVNSGYRMPGIFGMDGGKPFYLDKDPNTGDITFTPGQQKKSISSNEVETNGTSEGTGKKKKPMPIIIHSYSSTKMQGQQRRPVNKFVPKKPTFFYGNRTSTLAPPRLPSFYPKVQSLSDFKNSMGIKTSSTSTTVTPTTEPPTTTTTRTTTTPTTTTTTTTTTHAPPTTTTEEFRLVTLKASQSSSPTFPPGYDPYLPFDLLQLQTKRPDLIEIPAVVQEIHPQDAGSSFTPTGIFSDPKEEDIIGSVETVPLDYIHQPNLAIEPVVLTTGPTLSIPGLEDTSATSSGINPTPRIPLETSSGGTVVAQEGVTEQEEYDYDYDPSLPPQQQAPPPGAQFPPFFGPYNNNPQGPPNSFNSFGPPGQYPQPPWYYPPPPGQQQFYPPWGPYPKPPMGFQPQLPSGQQHLPQQPPMQHQIPQQPHVPALLPNQQLPPPVVSAQPDVLSTTAAATTERSSTHPTTTISSTQATTTTEATTPEPIIIPDDDVKLEVEEETSNEAQVSLETPSGPGFNPIQLPNENHQQHPASPPHHFRPPPNFRPPYGPPPHHFNRPGMYPPPPPFGIPHRQNFPFRPPPPVGELMKNRVPSPMGEVPVQVFPKETAAPTIPTSPAPALQHKEPLVIVQMQEKLASSEVHYNHVPNPTTAAPEPIIPEAKTLTTTTLTTTTLKPTTELLRAEQPEPSTTFPPALPVQFITSPEPITTEVLSTEPTTVLTTTTTTLPPTQSSTTLPPTTQSSTTAPLPTKPTTTAALVWSTEPTTITTFVPQKPSTVIMVKIPPAPPTSTVVAPTTPPPTIPPTSSTTSAEYETYYEDYPEEPTVMYNPYNNAQGQYYSNQPAQQPNAPPPQIKQYYEPTESPKEPVYGQRPNIVTSDHAETSFQAQDSLATKTMQANEGIYKQNVYHLPYQPHAQQPIQLPPRVAPTPATTTTTTTTQKPPTTTQRTTTQTPTTSQRSTTSTTRGTTTITTTIIPPPPVKINFKPSQVDNFFISAEQILNEPGSLSILENEPDEEEFEEEDDELPSLPNILPQFRPNANVDPSERLPLFGEGEKKVSSSAERIKTKIPEGPVEIPQQSVEQYEDEMEEAKRNVTAENNLDNNQDITGMFPPAPHPQHPPYPRPSTAASFLSNLFYGSKRGPPLPPHVMIGYGNETMRPWGHPPPGHVAKFPPGQYPPPNGQFGQGPPLPQGQGISVPLPSSVHFPGQGPPHNLGSQQPPPGFFQAPNTQKPLPNEDPSSQSQVHPPQQQNKFPSQPPNQIAPPPGGQNQGRPILMHGPPPGNLPPQFHNHSPGQGPPHPPNGFFTKAHPSHGQGHFLQHPPNGKFQDDNQLKRNGQRPPFPPPPPGFYRGPAPPMPPSISLQAPPNTQHPQHFPPQQIPSSPAPSLTGPASHDLRARLESSATSSEEVIYVTQEELEKLKQNGQGDEFIEYSDEVEVPAGQAQQSKPQLTPPAKTSPNSISPQQQLTAESVPDPVIVQPPPPQKSSREAETVQKNSTPPEEPLSTHTQLVVSTAQAHSPVDQKTPLARMEPRYSQEVSYESGTSFQPSATPPHHNYFAPHQQHHQPSFPSSQAPPPNIQIQNRVPPPHHQYHPQTQAEPKLKPSQLLDYDDLITGPLVDVTRDSGPRDIIVKSSFSHDGGSRQPEKPPSSSGWQGAVEKVALDDSIKFMLPGGGTKASGSIQWGGFQPIN